MPHLFTIGYEQTAPGPVLAELNHAKVGILVDVRAIAASRKPGFSKRQLAAALDEAGIQYLHLQKLGTPAEGRLAARAGDTRTLWRIYNKHLKTPDAREAMDELLALVRSRKRICLLCFERDPKMCHRSRIADIVREKTGVTIRNLVPDLLSEFLQKKPR
jgi:uncharacterized protein (DUF488 family)